MRFSILCVTNWNVLSDLQEFPVRAMRPMLAVLVLVGLLAGQGRCEDSAKPNFLVIVVDDLGYGDLSSYGATDLKSPNIDRLIASGVKFTRGYANCPVCSPTRASILSGRYPELVGVPGVIRTRPENNWGYLAPSARLLPTLLKPQGYDTAAIGKWHLGLKAPNVPNERGFDLFQGFLGDMMDDYYNHRRHGINYMRKNGEEIDPKGHATDLFTTWAEDYLRSRREQSRPFFLYLAYNAPHTPIQPPQEWVKKVIEREKGIDDKRAKLVALIEHLDHGIGRVMQALSESEQADNTVIVFVSDNGGQLNAGARNGDLRDGKQSMYEGGIRVPMAFVWPSRISRSSICNEQVMTMDILPTLCEIAGAEIPSTSDGISLLELITGVRKELPRRDLFFHRREGGNRYGGMITNAMIRGEWKLVRNTPFTPIELYNLRDDPQEQNDLAGKNRKVFNEMSAALRKQIQRGGAVPWQASKNLSQLP